MKNALQIGQQRNSDVKFIISAVTHELSEMAYLEYFGAWEGMGGMQGFFDLCVELTEEVMLTEGSAYLKWLDYWIAKPDDGTYCKSFYEVTGEISFDWYHMNKARELFQSRFAKDEPSDILEQMSERIGCILSNFSEDDRVKLIEGSNTHCNKLTKDKDVRDTLEFLKGKGLTISLGAVTEIFNDFKQ